MTRSFSVTLSSHRRDLSEGLGCAFVSAAFCAGPVAILMLLPDSSGLAAFGAVLGGLLLGCVLAVGAVTLCAVLPRHVEWLRHTTLHAQPVTVTEAGFHSHATGEVAWHQVIRFDESTGEDNHPLGHWLLDLHDGRHWRVSAAAEDATGLAGLVAACDAALARQEAARNADGTPRVIQTWRIHQAVLDVFDRLPHAIAIPAALWAVLAAQSGRGWVLLAAPIIYGTGWLCWLFLVSPLFVHLSGSERYQPIMIDDGRLLDTRGRVLLSLAESDWMLRQQREVFNSTRPVLTFWQGRRKRLELVVHEVDSGRPSSQQALVDALRTHYAARQRRG